MMKTASVTFGAATLTLLGFSPALAADWPTSIVGTWSMQANQTQTRLVISSQGGSGLCKTIVGTMTDVTPSGQSNLIEGFYCPRSGRLSFVRKNRSTNDTFQVYSGNLSDGGTRLFMGGVFGQVNGTRIGEYNFSASK
jgi:hypothetical protein